MQLRLNAKCLTFLNAWNVLGLIFFILIRSIGVQLTCNWTFDIKKRPRIYCCWYSHCISTQFEWIYAFSTSSQFYFEQWILYFIDWSYIGCIQWLHSEPFVRLDLFIFENFSRQQLLSLQQVCWFVTVLMNLDWMYGWAWEHS